ncbi:hypothetical protein LS684_18430 [Cytobacillus spongiae]|uniref:hypothetical protein n=1 Tax=Cytobacillus spongiae TaxID=2901381 RepID=UPI001F2768E9|nr:hypothetical protein [Cytobacillus spongiae]UII55581.1 hypothetical protein LS684_18430 [Cytobacillus spongiae]
MKYFYKTQLFSLVYALVGLLYANLFYFLFSQSIPIVRPLLYVITIILAIVYSITARKYLEGRWISIVYLIVPYFLYLLFFVFLEEALLSSKIKLDTFYFVFEQVNAGHVVSILIGTAMGIYFAKNSVKHDA